MTDAALVAALRAGTPQAFEQTYERYKGDVLALVAAMLGRREGAWDALHDVFLSFARQARKLAPDTNLKAYLLTAAANRARDRLRKRRDAVTSLDGAAAVPSPRIHDPVNLAIKAEEADRLWEAVVNLPDPQRIVIALRIYGDLGFRQIADVEGISENTAQSRYRYGLEKLRRAYAGVEQ